MKSGKEFTVSEVAAQSGVTVRALHYYDSVGLLCPSRVTESGYRMYDGDALLRLQEILFLRELDFSLTEIRDILESPNYTRNEALSKQRELLRLKRERLDGLIGLIGEMLEGKNETNLDRFNEREIIMKKNEFANEVKERWGNTAQFGEFEKKTSGYGEKEWKNMDDAMSAMLDKAAAIRNEKPDGSAGLAFAKEWQQFISENYYPCDDAMLANLGMMYTADERFMKNINSHGEGTAEFLSAAIAAYCAR
ncbi:MAG: MerR family transcriptional regulator [Eubacteriales bacterium]|nr:MerR family transcriptional regulator [Eubacteriales bacterium]MDD3881590.1 MerR family transcriptional regulator [Eubacteriales bacterium]MDD4512351.1 MerR family transcriptional regulator [Eubacteriales bacterium]